MKIELKQSPFDPWDELRSYQTSLEQSSGKIGAACVFVGSMRDFNVGDRVTAMELEHYPEMTAPYLEKLALEASEKWRLENVLLMHRYGRIHPDDTIVLIAAWSSHRVEAFEACRHLIEELKKRAPFWKKETLADQSSRWVEQKNL